jgi:hypothetical protein
MAIEEDVGLCNALIMSKAGSPFLQRWMEQYVDFSDRQWNHKSVVTPYQLYMKGDPDITVLDSHTWFYPMYTGDDEGFFRLWFGKSFWQIDRNYGVHLWRWPHSPIPELMSPEIVREIDTPFFCAIRKLFDNVANDGYVSLSADQDPNCRPIWMAQINHTQPALISQYDFMQDKTTTKWLDSSGHRLHGWAPRGTELHPVSNSTSEIGRNFAPGSFAVLPVPVDYDARTGSVDIAVKVAESDWRGLEMLLFKTRIDQSDELLLFLVPDPWAKSHRLKVRWRSKSSKSDDFEATSINV